MRKIYPLPKKPCFGSAGGQVAKLAFKLKLGL
jgi:hypothetical protein